MENQLHQRRTLDIFGLDMFDAGDVQEVILVVIGEKSFHLAMDPFRRKAELQRSAGAPSFGKMSIDIRRSARIEHSAIDRTATKMVIGRRIADKTSHIVEPSVELLTWRQRGGRVRDLLVRHLGQVSPAISPVWPRHRQFPLGQVGVVHLRLQRWKPGPRGNGRSPVPR